MKTTDQTCKHCRHWGRHWHHVCDLIDMGEPDESDLKSAYVHVTVADDHGLDANLITGPDFGCILFQPKTNEQSI